MLIKKFIAFTVAAIIAAPMAHAGDASTFEVLGFSQDGKIFAFEEFGIQDGSGFPYANRFYINTSTDKYLQNTPIRVRIDNESASLDSVREEAKNKAKSIISDQELNQNKGFLSGWNAVTELSADPYRISVNPRPVFPPIDAALEFQLDEINMEPTETCQLFEKSAGFRLTKIATEPGQETRIIHQDITVPTSRGCPLSYRLAGVYTFFPSSGEPVFATIITIRSGGFEGPDHRFMAVTGIF